MDAKINAAIDKSRLEYEKLNYLAGQPSLMQKIEEETFTVNNRNNQLRWYFPKQVKNNQLIIMVHGGGYIAGSLTTHDVQARKISNDNQLPVLAFAYERAPESKFPNQIDDLIVLIDHVKNEHNYQSVILLGDSAGGTIIAGTLEKLLSANSKLSSFISGQVLLYAALSFEFKTASIQTLGDKYFPTKTALKENRDFYLNNDTEITNPIASPVLGNNFSILPPTFVLVEEFDPLRDEGIEYFNKLNGPEGNQQENQLIDAKGVQHGFLQYFVQPQNVAAAEQTFTALKKFIKNLN